MTMTQESFSQLEVGLEASWLPPAETTDEAKSAAHVSPRKARKSIPRRIWSGIGTLMTCVAVLVAALALVLAIASRFGPSGGYGVFGHPVMSVLSGSMSPTIKTGDLVVDHPLAPGQASRLHVGQIISFRAGDGAIFTHRIHAVMRVNGLVEYQTKGDANNAPDAILVRPSQIVGLYAWKIPYGGYVLNGLHKPMTLILLIMAPLLWLLSSWLWGKAKEADREAAVVDKSGKEVAVM